MSVTVNCRKCGKLLRSSDEYAGWMVRCPDCQTVNQYSQKAEPEPAQEAGRPGTRVGPAQKPEGQVAEQRIEGPAERCGLCSKDFTVDPDQVRDTKGKLFHRTCYEEEVARRQAEQEPCPVCSLCGADIVGDSDHVQNTGGKHFHRQCHEKERARRQKKKQAQEVCKLCGTDFLVDSDKLKDPKGILYHHSCYDRELAKRQEKSRPRQTCSLCQQDFSADADQVQDSKGIRYHRRCYEREKARRQAPQKPRETCSLCGKGFSADPDRVQDTQGVLFHRSCYDRQLARRQAQAAQPAPAQPSQPAQPLEDPMGSPGGLGDLLDDLGTTPPAQPAAASPFEPVAMPLGASRRRGQEKKTWLYVLAGVGAALPVCLIAFFVIQAFMGPAEQQSGPVAAADGDGGEENADDESQDDTLVSPWDSPGSSEPPEPTTHRGRSPSAERNPEGRRRFSPPENANPAFWTGLVCGFVGFFVVLLLIYAVLLRVACVICQEPSPSFGKAMGISLAVIIANGISAGILDYMLDTTPGALLSLAVNVCINAAIYAGALETTFIKGIFIAIVQLVILFLIIAGVGFLIFLALSGAA